MRMGMGLGIKPSQAISFSNKYYLNFGGLDTDEYVEGTCPTQLSNVQGNSFSVCLWGRVTTYTDNRDKILFCCTEQRDANKYITIRTQNNNVYGAIDTGSGATAKTCSGALASGWHFFVATWDTSTFSFYIDGIKETTNAGEIPTGSTRGSFFFGGDGTDNFIGDIDEVVVYNKELTQSEVTTLFNSGTPCDANKVSGVVNYWRCEEGTGTDIDDSGSDNKDGVLTESGCWEEY